MEKKRGEEDLIVNSDRVTEREKEREIETERKIQTQKQRKIDSATSQAWKRFCIALLTKSIIVQLLFCFFFSFFVNYVITSRERKKEFLAGPMVPCLAHTFYFLFPFSCIFSSFSHFKSRSFFFCCLPFYFPSIAQERLKAIRTIHRRYDVPRLLLGAEGVVNDDETREDRKAKGGTGKKREL